MAATQRASWMASWLFASCEHSLAELRCILRNAASPAGGVTRVHGASAVTINSRTASHLTPALSWGLGVPLPVGCTAAAWCLLGGVEGQPIYSYICIYISLPDDSLPDDTVPSSANSALALIKRLRGIRHALEPLKQSLCL